MAKRKNMGKSSKLDRLLEIPKELNSGTPKLTIVGFEEIVLENYKGILEYEENLIRIDTHMGTVIINGFNLVLNQLTTDDIFIRGAIDSIEWEAIE